MNGTLWINSAYIVASLLFVLGIKWMGRQERARAGNVLSSVGMLLALGVTLLDQQILDYKWIACGVAIGTVIGLLLAYRVPMTAMPEMVALLNGFGGLASLLVAWAEYVEIRHTGWAQHLQALLSLPNIGPDVMQTHAGHISFVAVAIYSTVLIGGITFSGSLLAYAKLAGLVPGRAMVFTGQRTSNAILFFVLLVAGYYFACYTDVTAWSYGLLLLGVFGSLVLGVTGILPIGGGDMPVVISLLNSFSGLAGATAGFIIANTVLIVAGCMVGTSGIILSIIMCKAMNRPMKSVLLGGFGAQTASAAGGAAVELRSISPEDAYHVLEAAQKVLVIPGYGMAVAQAQHPIKELGKLLEDNGAEVHYAIHPVAGRMPGHMNVLLAEADVPYEQLIEMDAANALMPTVDVAIVIGANDVVNPAAVEDPASPIYGMPIIRAHEAKNVFVLKRGQGRGFSGIENALFGRANTTMIYGDAKATVSAIVNQFKSA